MQKKHPAAVRQGERLK